MLDPLNKLCKWRSIMAGWHLGTAPKETPGVQAMRDLMDKWLIMRVETSALAGLMLKKGVFTDKEYRTQLYAEATILDNHMEEAFPGFRSCEDGVEIYDIPLAQQTTRRLGFPP